MRVVKGKVVGREKVHRSASLPSMGLARVDGPRTALPYPACGDKLCSTKSRPSSTFRFMQMVYIDHVHIHLSAATFLFLSSVLSNNDKELVTLQSS